MGNKVTKESLIWCKAAQLGQCEHQTKGLSKTQAMNHCYIAQPIRVGCIEFKFSGAAEDAVQAVRGWLSCPRPYDCGGNCYVIKY